jgi:hypothetical protein
MKAMMAIARMLLVSCVFALQAPAHASERPLKSIAVMDFELIDDTLETAKFEEQQERLTSITRQLKEAFTREGFYVVLDTAPADELIRSLRASQNLRACNGCELDVGKTLGADRVALGWVQKVSNLILNINLEVKDVRTGRTVLQKSVDIRGNTDQSWARGISFMVRSMQEQNQGNR